jgi:hypothetical protein
MVALLSELCHPQAALEAATQDRTKPKKAKMPQTDYSRFLVI